METKKVSLSQLLRSYSKITIPDIQRDYVMGSGGEKLKRMFDAMLECKKKAEEFDFSCLVGYKDENNNLFVYDGQQRLVTLICLCSYLNSDTDKDNKALLDKLSFTKRDEANKWLRDTQLIKENGAVDFTTYSLARLINTYKTCKIKKEDKHAYGLSFAYELSVANELSFDFFFDKVYFDLVLVDEVSDVEQFFFEINDGLDLRDYEIYKAKLYHHVRGILGEKEFKNFALKMENKWLNFFLQYSGEGYNEEEGLVFFLKYCFRMMWIEENGNANEFRESDVSWIKIGHLSRIERILDAVIEVPVVNPNPNKNGSVASCISHRYYHWEISDQDYVSMLDIFLKNIYRKETYTDVVMWCYISKLPDFIDNQDELYKYLRFVKKLLNNSRNICNLAEIFFNDYGIYEKNIKYLRYHVKGIPSYYPDTLDYYGHADIEDIDFFHAIIIMNNKWIMNKDLKDNIDLACEECKNNFLKSILEKERCKENSEDKLLIAKYENLPFINGLVDNFVEYSNYTCQLKQWANDKMYEMLKSIQLKNYKSEYKDILEFIYKNKIDINSCIFRNVVIKFFNRLKKEKLIAKYSIICHTWCDLFTNENFVISQNGYPDCLTVIPDGGIEYNCIIQPRENDSQKSFASGDDIKPIEKNKIVVFDIGNFSRFFSWISKKQDGTYVVYDKMKNTTVQCRELPPYLYYSKDVIDKILSVNKKVFYAYSDYREDWIYEGAKRLNDLLIIIYLNKKGIEDRVNFLEQQKGKKVLQEIDGEYYFITLYPII